ncbi:hypothetical protein GOBAR_AA13558 [Gossypium barbadense]|uniref:Cathepsin propeptide inhibitor domain-containing protein n=1 Tax=Gossypium barbadense TaxID=3634 RepID=A0A2P5XUS5_GOSBA|nr:hypothetical protein GOBAR_AA13558 [Gossypium barbadense]
MASTTPCLALLFVLGIWAFQVSSRSIPEVSMSDKFEQWMASYGRVYQDAFEKDKRFQIFKENVEYIESPQCGHTLGVALGHFSARWAAMEGITKLKNGNACLHYQSQELLVDYDEGCSGGLTTESNYFDWEPCNHKKAAAPNHCPLRSVTKTLPCNSESGTVKKQLRNYRNRLALMPVGC